ncbi:uncharacterized protein [Salminus brasiliensis]|uniref:uncharacterized protein n=1 Tax=Salminus brasiliensis TaxID=930266 RepID=UPI003B82EDB8
MPLNPGQRTFLLLLVLLQPSLSVESDLTTSVEGRAGKDLETTFTFRSSITNRNSLSVQRDKTKIKNFLENKISCLPSPPAQKQQIDFCIRKKSSTEITLRFINPAANDTGIYDLVAYFDNHLLPFIESSKINLTIHPSDVTTTPALTSSNKYNSSSPHMHPSRTILHWIIFIAIVTTLVLVLAGLLVWFFRTYRTKSGDTPAPNPSAAQQGSCPKTNAVPVVSCVEYGVLDFQNRPSRPERRSREVEVDAEGVEYAAIMFPPQKKRT